MNEEQQILIENYKRLPVDVQEVVRSIVQRGRIAQMLAQYNIPGEQLEAITEETLLVLLGLQHVSDYELNLKSVAGLDSDLASTIAGHVHRKIFRSINESLEKIGEIQKAFAGEVGHSTNEKTENVGIGKEKIKDKGIVDTLRGKENVDTFDTKIRERLFPQIKSGGVENEKTKEKGIVDTLKVSVPQAKRLPASTWFVSRERQDIANKLRENLDKTERLIMLVRNFGRPSNNQTPNTQK